MKVDFDETFFFMKMVLMKVVFTCWWLEVGGWWGVGSGGGGRGERRGVRRDGKGVTVYPVFQIL